MAVDPFCIKGHLRTERPNGDLVCRICHNANRDRRDQNGRSPGRTTRPTQLTPRCPRGHKKVRRASGDLGCQWCDSARKRELRRMEREGACPHVGAEGFEAVLSLDLRLVCLACVAEGLAA